MRVMNEKVYATVGWTVTDILELRPRWTEERAEKFLQRYSGKITDAIVSNSWSLIETIIENFGKGKC